MTPAQFCEQVSQLECKSVAPACLASETDCLITRQAFWTARATEQESAGRTLDPANAKTCLARVKAVYGVLAKSLAIQASDFQSLDKACDRVFHGLAKVNEVCGVDEDCTDGLVCDKGRCGTPSQRGPDQPCANPGEYCPQGYICDDSTGLWICAARAGAGAACTLASTCLETLRCANGICTDGLVIGLYCQADGDCASGFCEPFAQRCANDVRFAMGTPACQAFQPSPTPPSPSGPDASAD